MNSTCTLLNYPDFTFTQKELLSFQDKGVKFESNSDKGSPKFYPSIQLFDGFTEIDYRVVETPSNKALFEKLTGINLKKTKPRVHAELIQAWALDDSLVIEYWSTYTGKWISALDDIHIWCKNTEYRIKPSVDFEAVSKGLSQGISTCKAMLVLSEEV
jgi:hypothetical protein